MRRAAAPRRQMRPAHLHHNRGASALPLPLRNTRPYGDLPASCIRLSATAIQLAQLRPAWMRPSPFRRPLNDEQPARAIPAFDLMHYVIRMLKMPFVQPLSGASTRSQQRAVDSRPGERRREYHVYGVLRASVCVLLINQAGLALLTPRHRMRIAFKQPLTCTSCVYSFPCWLL